MVVDTGMVCELVVSDCAVFAAKQSMGYRGAGEFSATVSITDHDGEQNQPQYPQVVHGLWNLKNNVRINKKENKQPWLA